jgi:hypothetical protein
MRQVRDTLIWLGLSMVVTAVVYYTPRFANYVNASESENFSVGINPRPIASHVQPITSRHSFHSITDLPH